MGYLRRNVVINLNEFLVIDESGILIGLPLLNIFKGKKRLPENFLTIKLQTIWLLYFLVALISNDLNMINRFVLYVIFQAICIQ